MKRKILCKPLLFLTGFLLIDCCGCINIEEPVFLTQKPDWNVRLKDITRSDLAARDGWRCLNIYLKEGDLLKLESAMSYFNCCWRFNPNNYNSFWGIGIIRGIQATSEDHPDQVEIYLNQSVEFIQKAQTLHPPENETDNISLDLINAYHGLAHFYAKAHPSLSAEYFQKAEKLLNKVIEEEPTNGRAYFLKAVNLYYQGNVEKAREYVKKAQSNNFSVPDDFLSAITHDKPSDPK